VICILKEYGALQETDSPVGQTVPDCLATILGIAEDAPNQFSQAKSL
jgi:hypothetical protein